MTTCVEKYVCSSSLFLTAEKWRRRRNVFPMVFTLVECMKRNVSIVIGPENRLKANVGFTMLRFNLFSSANQVPLWQKWSFSLLEFEVALEKFVFQSAIFSFVSLVEAFILALWSVMLMLWLILWFYYFFISFDLVPSSVCSLNEWAWNFVSPSHMMNYFQ